MNEQYYHQPHCNAPSHVKPFAKGVSCSCRKIEEIYPTLCEKTKSIVKACELVIQCHEDWQADVQTTPITLVQACEQLNCLLERIKSPESV